jgi:predicted metal-binding protein
LRELLFEAGDRTQLGCADGCEIFGMREEHSPSVTYPLMEVNRTLGSLGGEVWSNIVDTQ